MTKKQQQELLNCTVNQISGYDSTNVLKFIIANSDKATRCKLEQYLMDNFNHEYVIAYKEMFEN